jgi:hypothetical protein
MMPPAHAGLMRTRRPYAMPPTLDLLALFLVLALQVVVAPAAAQSPSAVLASVPPPARNGYADQLKPRRKAPPMLVNQPYAPIRNSDDQADIPEIEMFVGESRVFPSPASRWATARS